MKHRVRLGWLILAAAFLLLGRATPARAEAEPNRPVFLYSRYFNAKGDTRYLPDGSFKDVLDRLRESFEVRVHDLPLTPKTLKGVAVVMIANPNDKAVGDNPPPRHCSTKNIATLTRYVAKGGGLIVLGNQANHNLETSDMNKLLAKFGIQFVNEFTDAKQLILPPNALLLGGLRWAYYSGNSLRIQEDHPAVPRAIVTNDLTQKPIKGTRDHPGVLLAGAKWKSGRVIVATDAGWLTNDALSGKGIGGVAITDHQNWEIMERLSLWLAAGGSEPIDL